MNLTERQIGWLESLIDSRGVFTMSQSYKNVPGKLTKRHCFDILISFYGLPDPVKNKLVKMLGLSKNNNKRRSQSILAKKLREILPLVRLVAKKDRADLFIEALDILKSRYHSPYSVTVRSDNELTAIITTVQRLNREAVK